MILRTSPRRSTGAIDGLGEPDVLVYNTAVLRPDKPTELSAAEWNGRLAVNVSGAKVAADAVLPRLRDGHGTLLFTGGGFGLHSSPDFTAMSVGKAALRAYTDDRDGSAGNEQLLPRVGP